MGHMIWISDFDLSGGNIVCGCIARKSFVIWYLIIRQFMDFKVSQCLGYLAGYNTEKKTIASTF